MELEINQSITDRLFEATMDKLQEAWLTRGPTLWGNNGDVMLSLYRYEQTVEMLISGEVNDYLA